ncbi:MAG TPA: porin family protein [Bacteroidales bacterium]|nr:porin family protein [Bacteroidales bacterium]
MKRRILYIVLPLFFLLVNISLFGQKQKPKNESWYDEKLLHFGFSLGFNAMDFNITPSQSFLESDSLYPEVSTLNPGINIQIVTDVRPGKYFDVRFLPGVSFGQRVISYYRNRVLYDTPQRLESSFLEFPLLLKYKGDRLNNVRPYVIGGLNYRYDLAGKREFDEERTVYIRLKRPDLYYEVGAGLDFYLTYFKLSVELKMSTGIRDVLVKEADIRHPEYFSAIEKMKSQIWVLSFHFE